MREKITAWLISTAMVLSLFAAVPVAASAVESYDAEIYVVDGTGTGDGWSFASGEIWINEDGSYFVYGGGTETGNRLRVKTGVTASVTLDNVNINVALPFEVAGTANVTMTLKDGSVNTFRSGGGHAGIRVQPSATLTITTAGQSIGDGSLFAYGSADSSSHWATAGIGGSELEASGIIVIDGGAIFAKGGDGRSPGAWRGPGAAGIGGASTRSCGDITINGGTVMAFGGGVNPEGAGIGGGSSDPASYAGKITINGGTVRAYSGQPSSGDSASGAGIGFCASIAIADTADVQAYSSGNHPAICGTAAASGHSAYLLNFALDVRVSSDMDVTITQIDDDTETFELTLPVNYKNFAATVETGNDYTAALSDGSKKIVSLADESTDFPSICDLPEMAFSSVNVKLKANPVCMIGEAGYETLDEALAAASSTDTIRLLASINHSSSIVADNRVLNIDLNGFDLTVENVAGHALEAKNNGALNIADEDGDGVLTVNSSGEYKHCVNAISGGTVNIRGNLTAAISTGAPSYQNVIGAYADGAGSAISLTGNTAGHMAGAYSQNGAVITITGDVSGAYYGALSAYNGSVGITGNVSGSRALVAEYGGQTTVEGDITGSQYAIDATSGTGWDAPIVRVTGNVTGVGGAAISASNEADIQVTGDVTGYIAVSGSTYACPEVTINGDIAVGGGFGVSVSYGGTVTVEGSILDASPYLMLDNQAVGKDNYELSGDYLKYSNSTAGDPAPYAANTVYVAKPVNPSASAVEITGTDTVGQPLTGSYTYHAGSVGAEGDTSFRWLRVAGTPSQLGQPYLLYTTNNIAGVEYAPGGPPNPTQFTVDGPSHIAKISNYHYWHSHVPGTISLVGTDSTVYGPWETASDGYWSVFPDIEVPAGTYTVVDSQPGSWSFNPQSGNAGMCEIVGYTVISGATAQTYTLQAADLDHSILFEVTPEDADGNRGAAALSDVFGPVTSDTPLNHGTLQFEASSHGTYEGYNGWMIGVTRTGGSDGEVSVSYAMADRTAVAGTNYVAYSGTLTWADGDSSRKVIMFTSHNDSVYSGYLTLTCTLSNPTGGAVLGEQNPLDIQISDNDAPPVPTGLTAAAGSGKVTLSWNSVKDAYYQVYCSQTSGSFIEADLVNSVYDGTSYTVTGLMPGHIYYFAVKAGHNIYYSDFSETASAVPTGGTSGGSSPSTPVIPTYNADVTAGGGTQTTLPVTVNKDNGTASVDTGSGKLTSDGTVITMPRVPNVNTYSVGIPVPDLSTTGVQGTLTLDTGAGSITVPSNMLTDAVGVDGDKALITVGEGDKSALTDDVKAAIGDRPLIQLTLSIDGRQTDWSNPGAPVTVSIPYTPTSAELENPESIIVWYIDGSGNVVTVTNGRYDEMTGMVIFSTTHFSDYAVAYNKVGFNDIASTAWYGKAVSFIAAREITTGTGNGNYSPEARLTRSEFIVLMMRAYGITPEENPTDNFADAGDTWYTGYLAAAKRLGISNGVGNNTFAPDKSITRQEMFALLYNALKVIGEIPTSTSGRTLSDFSDANSIASWAQEAMALLVETGTISGSGGKLNPTGTSTRAEMAQVLYNLLIK